MPATGRRRAPRDQPGTAAAAAGQGNPASEETAREICLRLLTAAPKTRAQLATALRRRGVPDDVADAVLGRFTEVGLIDDVAFARAWVASRHHGRGLARRVLETELGQRGVAADAVRDAVSAVSADEELETARRLVAKRVAASRGKPFPARARQLVGMLARKGYQPGLAYQVVREALDADGAASPESWEEAAALGEDALLG